eukprot:TRINITY_DN10463_c0_g1_i2.p1 TRINITY_DN10463_c0_g1~~TRINITY_DN10463_c0_g1_i2.p1  ORF type:complete len:1181 (+),score=207.51 TRINITY_DN10463_c0_g1_i2:152-3694(+)
MAPAIALPPAFGDDAAGRPMRSRQHAGDGRSVAGVGASCDPARASAIGLASCCGSSGCSSPSMKDQNQVLDTLGSLQRALSLTECDALWRENHQLRSDVVAWKDEAALRQRELSELRIEVGKLHAGLDAERSRSQHLAAQLVSAQKAVESAAWKASSSARFCHSATQQNGPPGADAGVGAWPGDGAESWSLWEGCCRSAASTTSAVFRGGGGGGGYGEIPQSPQQQHVRPSSGGRSPSPPALIPRGGQWRERASCKREATASGRSTSPAASARFMGGSSDSGLEARATARRLADEVASAASLHAAELSEMQAKQSRAIESMQTEVDVAYARSRIAEARCVKLAGELRRAAATTDVLVCGSRRLATLAALFTAWCRFLAAATAAGHGLDLLKADRRASDAEAAAHMRLCIAGDAVFQARLIRAARHFWAAWAELAQRQQRARDEQGLRTTLLRCQFARHAQVSWLCVRQAADTFELMALMLLARWRSLAASAALTGTRLGHREETIRSGVLEHGIEWIGLAFTRYFLLNNVLQAWHFDAALGRTSCISERRQAAAAAHLVRAETLVSAFKSRLGAVRNDALLEMAWLAFRAAVRELTHERQLDCAAAETCRRFRGDAGRCVRLAVDASLASRSRATAWCAWNGWMSIVVKNGLSRAMDGLSGRLNVARGRCRVALLRMVAWGARKRELYSVLYAWVRRLRFTADARELARVRDQCRSWRTAVVSLVGTKLARLQEQDAFFSAWQAWCSVRSLAQRLAEADVVRAQEAQFEKTMRMARAFSVERVSRAGFVLRSCLVGWRRLRSSEHLHGLEKQVDELRCAYGGLRFACCEQAAGLAECIRTADGAGIAYVCWVLWRRSKRERLLLEDLDGLQQLLGVLQAKLSSREAVLTTETFARLTATAEDEVEAKLSSREAAVTTNTFASVTATADTDMKATSASRFVGSESHHEHRRQAPEAVGRYVGRSFSPSPRVRRSDSTGCRKTTVSFGDGWQPGPRVGLKAAPTASSEATTRRRTLSPETPQQFGKRPVVLALAASLRPPSLRTGLEHDAAICNEGSAAGVAAAAAAAAAAAGAAALSAHTVPPAQAQRRTPRAITEPLQLQQQLMSPNVAHVPLLGTCSGFGSHMSSAPALCYSPCRDPSLGCGLASMGTIGTFPATSPLLLRSAAEPLPSTRTNSSRFMR